jgi:hypothetical protein
VTNISGYEDGLIELRRVCPKRRRKDRKKERVERNGAQVIKMWDDKLTKRELSRACSTRWTFAKYVQRFGWRI